MNKHVVKLIILFFVLILTGKHVFSANFSFLSFEHKEMNNFNLHFKQYIAAYKKYPEREKGLIMLEKAIIDWDKLISKTQQNNGDINTIGRMQVIKGLLLQAAGLAKQGRLEESKELSVPIRSEIFEIHRALNMLTPEDYMIYFHNAIMHRAEPLIAQKRYKELEMLIPLFNETVKKFKTPPKAVNSKLQYKRKYELLLEKLKKFIETIIKVNRYIDPEYGDFMLKRSIEKTHNETHKAFGNLYLSFPNGITWPKK